MLFSANPFDWTIPEKNKQGGWGYEISRGIEEIASEIPRGLIENNVEFPGWSRNNHVEFPGILVLGLKISEGYNTILWRFLGWSFVLPWIFRGKIKNLRIPGDILKSMSSTSPPLPCWLIFFQA